MESYSSRPRALITGATGGLGAAFAELLAAAGYDLCLVARARDKLEELARRLRDTHAVEIDVVAADLTDPAALTLVEQRIAQDGGLSLLVNSAGFATWGRFASQDADREENLLRLNILALVRLTRAALPGMTARGRGGVVNVASLAAFVPLPFAATYCGSKVFVLHFTQALHEELRETGVKVQALCPGFIRTGIFERAGVDVTGTPRWPWVDAKRVAKISLAMLRTQRVVCIPALRYRLLACLVRCLPDRAGQLLVRLILAKHQPA